MGTLDGLFTTGEGESRVPGLVSTLLGGILSLTPVSRSAGLLATTALTTLIDIPFESLTQVSDRSGTPRDLAQGSGSVIGGTVGSLVAPTISGTVASGLARAGVQGLRVTLVVISAEGAVAFGFAYVGATILAAIFDAGSENNKASLDTDLLRSLTNSIQSKNQIALDALLRGEENWERFQDRLDGITEDANSKERLINRFGSAEFAV